MNKIIILSLMFTGCAASVVDKQNQIEDCVSNHLRVLIRSEKALNEAFYESIVNSCKQIYQYRK